MFLSTARFKKENKEEEKEKDRKGRENECDKRVLTEKKRLDERDVDCQTKIEKYKRQRLI